MKLQNKYDAGALQYTLVVGIIIGMICISMLLVFQYRLERSANLEIESKLISNSQSGIYYGIERVKEGDREIVSLFDEKIYTTEIEKSDWGIYQVIKSTTSSKASEFTTVAMTGSHTLRDSLYVLQLMGKEYPLTLSGQTLIQGNVKVPKGVVRPAIKVGLAYEGGMPLTKGLVKKINQLPEIDVNSFYKKDNENVRYQIFDNIKKQKHSVSFKDSTQYFRTLQDTLHLQNIDLIGNIRLLGKAIVIHSNTQIKDVVIEADRVDIYSEFRGNVQIFAKEIKIHDNVKLEYPSALICNNFSSNDSIVLSIGNNSFIGGSVFVGKNIESHSFKRNVQFTMENSSMIQGELMVLSNARLKGRIYGSAYIDALIEDVGGTKYINYLRDVHLVRDSLPLNFCGFQINDNSHVVQWLY